MNNTASQSAPERKSLDITRLNELGNQAISLGLIAGHGHHQGQYEILRQGEIVTLSPQAAVRYLQALLPVAADSE